MITEEKLTTYLRNKYNPLAIIIHGSRASGKNRPHSDWDIVILKKEDINTVQELIEDNALDIVAVNPGISNEALLSEFGNVFSSAKVLSDTDNIGKDLIERSRVLASKGYQMSPQDYADKKMYLYRCVSRLMDFAKVDRISFTYHLSSFIQKSVNYWFQTRGRWSKSIYEASYEIKKDDPGFYKEIEIITSNDSPADKVEAAKRVYSMLFKG